VKSSSIFSVMFGLTVLGAGSESVLAQTSIAVPARNFCVDSGINVSRGDSLQFSASGQGSYGYEGSPVNSTPLTNPDGDRFVNGVNIGKKDDPNAIYQGFIGGLVGKVGANGNYFFIGGRNQLSMGQSGRLFLCYNDVANSFNNNTGGYKVSIDRIRDPNQQNTAGRSLSPSQQAQTERAPQVSQNINQFNRFEIGKLSTGERVLRVSREVMLQSPFLEAIRRPIRNSATEIDRPIDGIFVWDGSQLLFAGYDVESISDFKVGNQSYWVTRVRSQDGSGKVEVSQPKFVSSKVANINTSNYQFIRQFKQDYTINGFFYVTIANGNGLNVEAITYLVDLRITAANPNQNVVVCESSRYQELRNGNSTTQENPDCRTGQQAMARISPSPSQQTNTGRSLLLQEQGVLASGDSVLPSDNSLYDQYTFQGRAGQSVTVTVESSDFDTYVAVFSPDGKLLGKNDDINQSSKNSDLTVTIPSNGTYRVIVNGYDNKSRGRYALSVSTPTQQSATNPAPSQRQQDATGRSPSSSQQTPTAGRSPSPQQNPQRQTPTKGEDTIVYNNIVCTGKTRNLLGQESPASCRSKEADSRLIFNSITWERQADRSIKVEMKVFNQGSAEALIEIYDSKNRLVDLKIIDGNKPPTGLMDSGIDMFTRFPKSLFNQYPLTDSRKNLNEQEFSDNKKNSIIIPSGGSLKITKSSNQAFRYNAALLSLEIALLYSGDPKFAEDETVKQFLKKFAQEAYFSPTSKATINLFKSEPSAQAMFRMDVVDPKKAAVLLQQFVQYTVTIESDPSKNPFIGAFLDVYKDVGNIGLEIALDKFILPGLGTFAKNTRITGSTLNTFARAADLYYATAAGEKATITLQDAERLRN